MKILSFIEGPEIIKKILKHLGLWDVKPRPRPCTKVDSEETRTIMEGSFSQRLPSDNWLYVDPEYPDIFPA